MPHLTHAVVLGAALSMFSATAALAQSNLDRFETLSERITQLTYQGIAEQYNVSPDIFPEVEWDRPMRRAGRCVLRAYEDEVGEDGVAQFLASFDTALTAADPTDLLSGNFTGQLPGGLSTQNQQRIQNQCGMLELEMNRLANSGVLQALQNR